MSLLLLALTGGGLSAIAVLPAGAQTGSAVVPAGATQQLARAPEKQPDPMRQVRASRGRPVLETPPNAVLRSVASDPAVRSAVSAPDAEPAPPAAAARPVAPAAAPDKPAAPVLPGCDPGAPDLARGSNGKLPAGVLCALPGEANERLRADAAVAFVRLATAYEQHFGTPICLTDGYRPIGEQYVLRRSKPRLAARPGFSEHGWGLAVDLSCGVQSSRSPQHAWLRENAGRFGWFLPDWARPGGARPEPWHWEYDEKTAPRP